MAYIPQNSGIYKTTPPTLSDGQYYPVQLDVNGNQKVVIQGTPAVSVSGTVTVSGSVSISNFPATQPVSGTVAVSNFPATQPVSGSVSVSNLPATQAVSSTQLPAALDGSGNLKVAVQNASIPVTGTFWQATQPVSGTVAVSNFPATQTVTFGSPQHVILDSGSISNTSFGVTGDVAIVNSSTVGKTKLAVTADPITFASAQHVIVDSATLGTITVADGGGSLTVDSAQLPSALDGSGYLKVHEQGTANVSIQNASIAVTGTFWQATQPVSLASLPALATGSNVIGKVSIDQTTPGTTNKVSIGTDGHVTIDNASLAVTGTFWQATQPVSGTVTANQGSANATPWNENLAQVGGSTISLGSKTSANSLPVVIASDQAAVAAKLTPQTSGGFSTYSNTIGATATSVKASAGQLYGWYIYNSGASAAYVQIFDAATGSVTLGSTAPKLSLGIPAGAGANILHETGIAFGTAITFACTATRSGSGAPAATLDVNFFYV